MSETGNPAVPWWKTAVVYQIYPRSFCDTTGNGIGDLEGVRSKLDHLVWLGVDALWLSPVFTSPMVDHGYDVADYCDIDPLFGSMADFDRLLAEAHDKDLRVLLDWVPNHTSSQHPWFVASRSSRDDPKRDWYLWADGEPGSPPNDWQAMFPAGPAWSWDEESGAWYLRLFTEAQPDLNWSNPDVATAMQDTLRFWLDKGVDGFRMDVVHLIGKDPARIHVDGAMPSDPDRTHAHLRAIREVVDGYEGDRVAVGETYIFDTDEVATYYGDDDELHLCFNFRPQFTPWDADAWRAEIAQVQASFKWPNWPTWVFSNHDIPRISTRYGGERAARVAAVALLTLRGTPFIYAGDEFGLADADVPPERRQDPAGFRDGCRAPIPWNAERAHGWAREQGWLPWPPEAGTRNLGTMRADETSILHLFRRLLEERRNSPALQLGDQSLLEDLPDGVVGWEREFRGDRRVVLVSFRDEETAVSTEAVDGMQITIASYGAPGDIGDGPLTLGRSQAAVLA